MKIVEKEDTTSVEVFWECQAAAVRIQEGLKTSIYSETFLKWFGDEYYKCRRLFSSFFSSLFLIFKIHYIAISLHLVYILLKLLYSFPNFLLRKILKIPHYGF